MDIAKLSMALSQVNVQQQSSLSVMKMALGKVEQSGEGVQKLMDSAQVSSAESVVHPHLGGSIDVKL